MKHSSSTRVAQADKVFHLALALFSACIFLLVVILISSAVQTYRNSSAVACTEEARLCADGSAVARMGPNCTFAPCPEDSLPDKPGITEEPLESTLPISKEGSSDNEQIRPNPVACTQDIKLCPNGGMVGRSGPNCEFAPCVSELEYESDH